MRAVLILLVFAVIAFRRAAQKQTAGGFWKLIFFRVKHSWRQGASNEDDFLSSSAI